MRWSGTSWSHQGPIQRRLAESASGSTISTRAPGADSLAVAGVFADTHGKPLGLCEFGADHTSVTEAQGDAFLAYFLGLFAARAAAGKLNGDLIYDDTGGNALAGAPASFVTLYRQIGSAL